MIEIFCVILVISLIVAIYFNERNRTQNILLKKQSDGIKDLVDSFSKCELVKAVPGAPPAESPDDGLPYIRSIPLDPKVAWFYLSNVYHIRPKFDFKQKNADGDPKLVGFRVSPCKMKYSERINMEFELDSSWDAVFQSIIESQSNYFGK